MLTSKSKLLAKNISNNCTSFCRCHKKSLLVTSQQSLGTQSLMWPKNKWQAAASQTADTGNQVAWRHWGLMEVTNKNEKHIKISNSVDNNLFKERNVTMAASLPSWHGRHCQREFCSILSHYPTGPEPQTQRLLLFSSKEKNGGVEHDEVPERPVSSEDKCCCCTLYLIVPHIIQLDMLHKGTCQQEEVFRLHRDDSSRGRLVGRDLARTMCLGK